MGIDYAAAKKLIALAGAGGAGGRVLMLGRHRMQLRARLRPALRRVLAASGVDLTVEDLEQVDGYGERFFTALGWDSVVSMDMSDYEGAEIVHDLNDPVPADLHGRFDLIYDGGTTEHVFDVATCMGNIADMLAPGGVLVSCAPGNGWFAHGFYQFGPELVYGYWKHGRGFDVLACSLLPEMPRDKEVAISDPALTGRRFRARGRVPAQRSYLYFEVRKGARAHPLKRAWQTDYVRRWADHDAEAGRTESEVIASRRAHFDHQPTGPGG